jgi:hypothetical protein
MQSLSSGRPKAGPVGIARNDDWVYFGCSFSAAELMQ